MIKFLGLFFLIISLVLIICYENQSVIMDFYAKKLVNPRSWGRIEIVQDKNTMNLQDIFQSTLVWQTLEQLIGFVAGVLICVIIGWKVSSCRHVYEKSFDNSMTEWYQRQNIFEKKLNALELQIVDFERRYLFTKKETPSKCDNTPAFIEERKQVTNESTTDKNNQNGEPEDLACQAVKMILKQNLDESNIECTLDKLNIILERLSKLNKENIHEENILTVLEIDTDSLDEQNCGTEFAKNEEYYEKENSGVENETSEIGKSSEKINEGEYQNEIHHEEVAENYSYPEVSSENSPYQLHPCCSTEKLSNLPISNTGAGECDETFRGKIVPVSQIPQYQELRKNQRQKSKVQKEYEVGKSIPFISCGKPADEVMAERVTPQTTPRKHSSVSTESGVDRSTCKGVRRKQKN